MAPFLYWCHLLPKAEIKQSQIQTRKILVYSITYQLNDCIFFQKCKHELYIRFSYEIPSLTDYIIIRMKYYLFSQNSKGKVILLNSSPKILQLTPYISWTAHIFLFYFFSFQHPVTGQLTFCHTSIFSNVSVSDDQ